ncbi:hypothetical protein ACFOOK_30630 [Micromonospora krabiensis]|uniref:Uncharacterized protein n=1 Tax=Micromonospora krabiensis TaxID=307121 RepID=A0A1C3N319_9ACTN|nr:hypothetical protein [Micromonospora krabiensis]SBV26983.1 hypothetical protein GA0070620_2481 [Micromonospora krabiensis]
MTSVSSLLAASLLAVPAAVAAPAVGPAAATTAGPVAVTAAAVTWTTANSNSSGDQDRPAIVANRNGHVAVVWEDDRDSSAPEDDTHSEIYLRLFTNGTSSYEVKLSGGGASGAAWRHVSPDVGLDDRGNAVVVWAADGDGNGYYNIQYRVVSPAGTVLGSGQANANANGQQVWPKVAVDPDGAPTSAAVGFTVAWEDVQGTSPATVRAAGFTGPTTKAYEVAASQTTGSHHRPDVAVSASGEALVVWDEDADANGAYNVGLTRLARANGAVVLSRRTANGQNGGQQQRASVAANFAGDFTVAWESDHTGTRGVWARSFTAAGAARHGEVEVSAGAGAPGVGIDDQDNVVVGWTVGSGAASDVWARGLNPDGTSAGRLAAQALSQTTAGRQEQMAIATSPWGEVAVCYTDDNDGNTFDQVLLGLGATNSTWLMSAEELRRLKARAAAAR